MEEMIFGIIVNGGDARSRAMNAIREAKSGNIDKAKELIEEANTFLSKAHDVQTELIQNEAAGNKTEMSLLMVHAQDHLMNAITVRDMAIEFINMYCEMQELKNNK
ncbi:PTS lactose/cellobiose transporter subunit IIA [Clostridium sp. C8-1-8]|uniref:PTS lactose/cellobiose transporter subunit IIA n=1 Tax=Clostridium sp. C8-1-8 TaxID=2698831 RepID=UPI00136B6727|nr:PTS lactose/cellobiose transporter subunit IIA [Clostridium sp. C8-1-8]